MALADLTYENIMTIFANTTISCEDAHNITKDVIALANRADLNTHEGRVNFAKDNVEIQQFIRKGRIVAAVKFLWDQRNSGAWYFSLKDSRDAVYEAYANDPAFIAAENRYH